MTVFMPEPHILLTVVQGTDCGSPAPSAAWRAGAWPWPAGSTQPISTSLTSSGLQAGAGYGRRDGGAAELRRRQRRKRALEAADGRARRPHDDDCVFRCRCHGRASSCGLLGDGARRRAHGQQPRRASSRAAVAHRRGGRAVVRCRPDGHPGQQAARRLLRARQETAASCRSAGNPARAGAAGGRRGARRPGRVGRAHPGDGGGGAAAGTGAYQRRRGRLLLCRRRLRRRSRGAAGRRGPGGGRASAGGQARAGHGGAHLHGRRGSGGARHRRHAGGRAGRHDRRPADS